MTETESLIKQCQQSALKYWLQQEPYHPHKDDVVAICVNLDTDNNEWEVWVDVSAKDAGPHVTDLSDDLYTRDASLKEALLCMIETIEELVCQSQKKDDEIITLNGKRYKLIDNNYEF